MTINSKVNKELIKYLGILFIAVILLYKIPHDSYSLSQYIIRPIKIYNIVLPLSGIIPIILIIISIKGILNLKKYAGKSKLLIFLVITALIVPFMYGTIDFAKTSYHWIINDGLNAIDIEDANINLGRNNDTDNIELNINLDIIDYGRRQNDFNIRVYLPKTLSKYLKMEYYDLADTYTTYGNQDVLTIEKQIVFNLNKVDAQKIFESQWYWEDVKYEFYNKNDVVEMIYHGY